MGNEGPVPAARVTNAADKNQVEHAEKAERLAEHDAERDMAFVASSPAGRRVLHWILEECRIMAGSELMPESIWHPSASIHYNAGVQDAGRAVLKRMKKSNFESFILMIREAEVREEVMRAQAERLAKKTKDEDGEDD